MAACERGEQAALFGLGLLDAAESSAFEQHLGSCPFCAADVRASGEIAVGLAGTLPVFTPPAKLRARALREATLPRGLVALVRGQQLQWKPTPFRGVEVARLYEDPARGELASLVRMAPGGRYPSHHHAGLEHCYVLDGDVIFEDHTLGPGDYTAGGPERDHSSATTTRGCLLFIIHNRLDQVYAH